MSGVRRYRAPKVHKSAELIHRLSLQPSFEVELEVFRAKFGIPQHGFERVEQKDEWWEALLQSPKIVLYYSELSELVRRHNLPPTKKIEAMLENIVQLKIFSDPFLIKKFTIQGLEPNRDGGELIETLFPTIDAVKRIGRPYVDVRIYKGSSQEDAQHFVKKNWEQVIGYLDRYTLTRENKRMKAKLNRERDALIYQLAKLPTLELVDKAGPFVGDKNKYNCISKILIRQGHTLSAEGVKKVLQRRETGTHKQTG